MPNFFPPFMLLLKQTYNTNHLVLKQYNKHEKCFIMISKYCLFHLFIQSFKKCITSYATIKTNVQHKSLNFEAIYQRRRRVFHHNIRTPRRRRKTRRTRTDSNEILYRSAFLPCAVYNAVHITFVLKCDRNPEV